MSVIVQPIKCRSRYESSCLLLRQTLKGLVYKDATLLTKLSFVLENMGIFY